MANSKSAAYAESMLPGRPIVDALAATLVLDNCPDRLGKERIRQTKSPTAVMKVCRRYRGTQRRFNAFVPRLRSLICQKRHPSMRVWENDAVSATPGFG